MTATVTTSRPYTFGALEIGARARQLIQAALDNHWVSAGPNVKLFEETFARTFGLHTAVATSSGTTAVFTAVSALHEFGAARGDEVIVPALSFVATSNAVLAAGFKPVFVDVRRDTLNIDAARIEAAITQRTRAILVVHTMGKPCAMGPIIEIARAHRLRVLEDSCEAHGATWQGRYVGGLGDAGAFSFYAAHMICTGEGGMVTSNQPEFGPILRSVRSHGRPDGTLYFQFDRFGFNCKMNDLEAALGVEGIEGFWPIFERRKANLRYLLEHTRDLEDKFHFIIEGPDEVVAPHAFPFTIRAGVDLDGRDLYRHLETHQIHVKTLFGSLPTQHRAFGFMGHRLGEFPEAEYVGRQGVHVGCHHLLTRAQLDDFLQILHDYAARA